MAHGVAGSTASAPTVELLDPTNASAGVSIYFGGGAGGAGCASRGIRYEMVCDSNAPTGAGPTSVVEHTPANCDITVHWPTATACEAADSDGCPAPPRPTPDQLVYHNMEVGALAG